MNTITRRRTSTPGGNCIFETDSQMKLSIMCERPTGSKNAKRECKLRYNRL
jgi:hypothetical protein